MADVRAYPGVPPVAAFGGTSTPSQSTPIVVDTTTGTLYTLVSGSVVVVGASAVWGP